jgi:hypothetical protein
MEYCEECSRTTDPKCPVCGKDSSVNDSDLAFVVQGYGYVYLWDQPICESCRKYHEWLQFVDDTEAKLQAAAIVGGWDIIKISFASNTRSRYFTLRRGNEQIKIRISDHGSAYCSEDYSFAMNPGFDDNDIDAVLRVIAEPRADEDGLMDAGA